MSVVFKKDFGMKRSTGERYCYIHDSIRGNVKGQLLLSMCAD